MFDSLRGREIVLAGGSGGLGSASAELLIAEGARVVVSYKSNRERAEKITGVAQAVLADLCLGEDRVRLLEAAPQMFGLVVFAGTAARFENYEVALEASHNANFLGPWLLAREAAARMKATGTPGSIVLISTMQAAAVFAGSSAYAAPKAALLHAGLILAKEYRGPANIRVNIICPGVNQAGMAEASIATGKYARYIDEGVIPRYGKATDVARTVRFLLEPDNYITGQVITVDGGLTL